MCDTRAILAQYKDRHDLGAIARKMEKRYFTLTRLLNPNDEYSLSVHDLISFLQATDDLTLLDHIEAAVGRAAITIKPQTNADLCSLTRAVGHSLSAYADAIADGKITRDEARHCAGELMRLVQVAMGLIQACHELGK